MNEAYLDHKDTTDEGYSEKRQDKGTELMAGQWLDLTQRKSQKVQDPSQKGQSNRSHTLQKLVTYSYALMKEIGEKVQEYGEESLKNRELGKLAKDIEKLQSKLHTILRSIQFEQKGDLDITKLPKEAQDLVK